MQPMFTEQETDQVRTWIVANLENPDYLLADGSINIDRLAGDISINMMIADDYEQEFYAFLNDAIEAHED